ncbi:MAG: hypothetical protein JST47_03720 [Bacteroidetes bacterium]|nr:hypothetical protein [Bacteroidota bacterium]
MNDEQLLVAELKKELLIEATEKIPLAELKRKLAQHINDLINSDFEKLVSLLYRIDINERKLKALLKEHKNEDAGALIAELIIERQLQKIITRAKFSKTSDHTNEEKW